MEKTTESEPKQDMPDELSQVEEETASAVSSSIESIATIPIAQFGKYVVTCEISEPGNFGEIQHLAQQLDQWWRSDNKFFVLVQGNDVPKIRFERIETDDEL